MKKMQIFEPAMCCSTGLCGVGVDPELLRISTVLSTLNKQGIEIERFNLTNSPIEFINNKTINALISGKDGVDCLPAVVLDGEIIMTGRYPTNEELATYYNISKDVFESKRKVSRMKATAKKSNGSCCSGENCC